MSVSISIPIAAKTAQTTAPVTTSIASAASAPLSSAQLAKETVNQLQTQANSGNKAALRELQRRQKLKQQQASESSGLGESVDARETASPQEPGKGTQVDKSA